MPASTEPSGPPSAAIGDVASLELEIDGGPDWPAELDGSLWILLPDLGQTGAGGEPMVVRLEPETGDEQARVPVGPRFCQGMAAGFDALWVCASDGMLRIDPATNTEAAHVPFRTARIFGRPAIGPDAVWSIGGEFADQVIRIDPASNAVTAAYPLGHAAVGLAYGSNALWATAATDGLLLRIEPATGAVTEHVNDLPSPWAVAAAAGSVWVSLYGSQDGPSPATGDPTLLRVDPESGDTTPIDIGGDPGEYADIWATEDAVWIRSITPVVLRVDPATNQVAWTATGNEAYGSLTVAFDALWVTNVEFQKVFRIDLADAR